MAKKIEITIRQIRERHHVTTKEGAREILAVISELAELVGRNLQVEDKGSIASDMHEVAQISRHWIGRTEGRDGK